MLALFAVPMLGLLAGGAAYFWVIGAGPSGPYHAAAAASAMAAFAAWAWARGAIMRNGLDARAMAWTGAAAASFLLSIALWSMPGALFGGGVLTAIVCVCLALYHKTNIKHKHMGLLREEA